ncbi:MAG TPA: hypothetical protein VJU14_10875 [Solirubrobacterales bacterium]|nr:hypothetical protein [Solirubrobacterales bacterium]
MSASSQKIVDAAVDAYTRMATEASYRPEGDGPGDLSAPPSQVDPTEARRYGERWANEDYEGSFATGTPTGPTRQATIFTIEAARLLCAGENRHALRLLEMARQEVEAVEDTEGESGTEDPGASKGEAPASIDGNGGSTPPESQGTGGEGTGQPPAPGAAA